MLSELKLRNYRGFRNHTIPLADFSVIVGQNNAGKSTIVEALRLISLALVRQRNLPFKDPPSWLDIGMINCGVSPSLSQMEINYETLFYGNNAPPAIIEARFQEQAGIKIYLGGENKVHAVIKNRRGRIVRSGTDAMKIGLGPMEILPQIAPLLNPEGIREDEYVKRNLSSTRASYHFRNQLRLFPDLFEEFAQLVETTWPKVKISRITSATIFRDEPLLLPVRNEDFEAEVAYMGHGLQMWLQIMWFLSRAGDADIVILDEPDVYAHPDLQRKLVRVLRARHRQTILTTHSVEIMSEVQPSEIVIVDRRGETSTFASSLPAFQSQIQGIGNLHNIHLARLAYSRRFIWVEGDDLWLLNEVQNRILPKSLTSFDSLPNKALGGWGEWSYNLETSIPHRNSFGEKIHTYCVLDSDYHTEEEIKERYDEARSHGVNLHVWKRKEIENYFLLPTAIHDLVADELKDKKRIPTVEGISKKIDEFARSLEEEAQDQFIASYLARDRRGGYPNAKRMAHQRMRLAREGENGLWHIVSGKRLFSLVSTWTQEKWGVTVSPNRVARTCAVGDLSAELVEVITAIEKLGKFSGWP